MYDTVIIGGGIIGCAVSRELARYDLQCILLERAPDVSDGTTKANSAIVHSGHSATPGSLMALYNIRGNALFEDGLDVTSGNSDVFHAAEDIRELQMQ